MTAPNADGPTAAERPRLVIVVSPIKISPGRFQARLESTNELLVGSSRQPFVDAARVLVEKGHDGNAMLVMKHLGTDIVALNGGTWIGRFRDDTGRQHYEALGGDGRRA